jgi:hypothetical protein
VAIEHLVIMKIREPAPQSQLQNLFRECEHQLEKIPGVVSVSIGANFRPNPSYTHALLIRFENREALESFMPHPSHVAAGTRLQALFTDFVIVDYETERS